VVSNDIAIEVLQSLIVSHRLHGDASLTVMVDDEERLRERVEVLIEAMAGSLEESMTFGTDISWANYAGADLCILSILESGVTPRPPDLR
jgi:hypothetical protein